MPHEHDGQHAHVGYKNVWRVCLHLPPVKHFCGIQLHSHDKRQQFVGRSYASERGLNLQLVTCCGYLRILLSRIIELPSYLSTGKHCFLDLLLESCTGCRVRLSIDFEWVAGHRCRSIVPTKSN